MKVTPSAVNVPPSRKTAPPRPAHRRRRHPGRPSRPAALCQSARECEVLQRQRCRAGHGEQTDIVAPVDRQPRRSRAVDRDRGVIVTTNAVGRRRCAAVSSRLRVIVCPASDGSNVMVWLCPRLGQVDRHAQRELARRHLGRRRSMLTTSGTDVVCVWKADVGTGRVEREAALVGGQAARPRCRRRWRRCRAGGPWSASARRSSPAGPGQGRQARQDDVAAGAIRSARPSRRCRSGCTS